jgi:pyrroline-5-carboxylate reductase
VKISFIGGGNMGEAILSALLSQKISSSGELTVSDVSQARRDYLREKYGVSVTADNREAASKGDVVVLAIKPQQLTDVAAGLKGAFRSPQLVLSIIAGARMDTLRQGLGHREVVRVMPNTPALVLKGASALSRGKNVSAEQMEMSLALFRAVGKAVEAEEKWLDTVTGLSGSGPAFVLLMIEALIDSGVLMGLPRHLSRELAVQTVLGTALMVEQTGRHPAELKDMITSPGGTTIYGLKVLEAKSVRGAFMEAVEAASRRSEELGKG